MTEVPAHFLGSWKLEKSENFEEFLESQGINWMMRKMMKGMPFGKIFRKEDDGSYTLVNDIPRKKHEIQFTVDVPLQTPHIMTGKLMDIVFRVEGPLLIEVHKYEDGSDDRHTYFLEDDMMVLERTHKEMVIKRWFKKIA